MKRLFLSLLAPLCCLSPFAQDYLPITVNKTISLVFPEAIRHVDLGSRDVLAHQVASAANVLFVKAAAASIVETNLTVVTADGQVYSFPLKYEPAPQKLVYNIARNKESGLDYGRMILDNPRTVQGISTFKYQMAAEVWGIYVRDSMLYFQIGVRNSSALNYDVGSLRFFVQDKRVWKKTPTQEIELQPKEIVGNAEQVRAGERNTLVVALPKFTIPDARYLSIALMEKGGGRHLHLKVRNWDILKAISLPAY